MKGNTKTTTRERQVASLAAPHRPAHTLWRTSTTLSTPHPLTHTYTDTQRLTLERRTRAQPSSSAHPRRAHLWKCQIMHGLSQTPFSAPLFSPIQQGVFLLPPRTFQHLLRVNILVSSPLNWLLKLHFLFTGIPPWELEIYCVLHSPSNESWKFKPKAFARGVRILSAAEL